MIRNIIAFGKADDYTFIIQSKATTDVDIAIFALYLLHDL